jgi:hypothetical protein
MENFQSFFKRDNVVKPTENSRTHHQSLSRGSNRKHLYMVGRSHSQQMEDINVEKFKKSNSSELFLSPIDAKNILKKYHIKHNPEVSYTKSINRTGISLRFDKVRQKWKLIKSRATT